MTAPFISPTSEGVLLALHVQPGASRSEVAGLHGQKLKIRIKAQAVDGKANSALIKFLAEVLGVSRAQITIQSGQSGRAKLIAVSGITIQQALDLLISYDD